MLDKKQRIYVCGHNGMVGSAIVRTLRDRGYNNLLLVERKKLDLRNPEKVQELFAQETIDIVIVAAAKVGGIHANSTYPVDFIHDNLMIAANICHAAHSFAVSRLLYLGSTCIYPRIAPQPMHESSLMSSQLEPTNEAYAVSKIAGIKLCEAYNKQYNCDFRAAMPTNLYGTNDNFHRENSHVLPSLMRRFHEAKLQQQAEVTVWGTGTPTREFLYVDDMAEACLHILNLERSTYLDVTGVDGLQINVGTGKEISIADLAQKVAAVVGYKGTIVFDSTKPDGTPRKVTDVSKIHKLGWHAQTNLEQGLTQVYQWLVERYEAGTFRQ